MHSAQRSSRAALQQALDGPAAPQLCCMPALAVSAPKTAAAEMQEAIADWVA